MDSLITAALLFAQESADVGGRGENPDEGTAFRLQRALPM